MNNVLPLAYIYFLVIIGIANLIMVFAIANSMKSRRDGIMFPILYAIVVMTGTILLNENWLDIKILIGDSIVTSKFFIPFFIFIFMVVATLAGIILTVVTNNEREKL